MLVMNGMKEVMTGNEVEAMKIHELKGEKA